MSHELPKVVINDPFGILSKKRFMKMHKKYNIVAPYDFVIKKGEITKISTKISFDCSMINNIRFTISPFVSKTKSKYPISCEVQKISQDEYKNEEISIEMKLTDEEIDEILIPKGTKIGFLHILSQKVHFDSLFEQTD